MKLLSVIVPTYNMAELLPRCLQSLLDSPCKEELDVIVVNDGSKDNSLAVAMDFQRRYPGIVNVIDKPNGNYGSTINAALPVAKGKYVKILDSDDWFDTQALTQFLAVLTSLQTDMAVTHFTQIGGGGDREVVRYNTMGREPYQYGKVYNMDDVLKDGYIRFFLMHAVAYRTQLLRDMNYKQTEGISYTDTEWVTYPVYFVQKIVFFDINLYQYNLAREGQTMNPAVLLKSVKQLDSVNDSLMAYYAENAAKTSLIRQTFLKQYHENRLRVLYKVFLLDMPRTDFDATLLDELDRKWTQLMDKFSFKVRLFPENKLLRIEYIRYWHKHHKRWPVWLEKLNAAMDVAVKWLYVKIFRR
jgi:glycosyltransferase involved in cell wall biosynthesis